MFSLDRWLSDFVGSRDGYATKSEYYDVAKQIAKTQLVSEGVHFGVDGRAILSGCEGCGEYQSERLMALASVAHRGY
jgi:hypothetical protein